MATVQSQGARPLAIVTGASSGIGYELATIAAEHGYDLIVAADQADIERAAQRLNGRGVHARSIQVDLSTDTGVRQLLELTGGRPVQALFANAGHGLGHAFLDQSPDDWLHVVNTNIVGTLLLIQQVGRQMRERGEGKILITGSIAGLMPGSFQAVYNATKAFVDSFAMALREELAGTGVDITCLMPGATETEFFARADMLDTKVGTEKKQDPHEVAQTGYDALMSGDDKVVAGWKNKVQAFMTNVLSDKTLAKMHTKQAAPGTAQH